MNSFVLRSVKQCSCIKNVCLRSLMKQKSIIPVTNRASFSSSASCLQKQSGTEASEKEVTPLKNEKDDLAHPTTNVSEEKLFNVNDSVIPGKFEKKYLVWGGMYATEADVPQYVRPGRISTAKDRCRVVLAMYLTLASLIACVTVIVVRSRERNSMLTAQLEKDKKEFNAVFNNPEYVNQGLKKAN